MKEKRQKSKMLEWALVYAREGWRVHPVCWVKDGTCQYHKNCTRSGKVPLIKWGSDEPSTTDEKTIRKWWAQWPDANIGVATGEVSGFIVLDADGEKGNQSLQALEDEYGPLPKTPEVLTGGGGWHLWFKWPGFHTKNSAQAVAPRLDIRADGGQVVVPPSLHVSGNNYEWDGDSKHPKREELAECPQWLVKLIQEKERGQTEQDTSRVDSDRILTKGLLRGERDAEINRLAWRLANNRHLKKVEAEAIIEKAIQEMEQPRGDPFTLDMGLEKLNRAWQKVRKNDGPEMDFSVQESGTTVYMVKDSQDAAAVESILKEGEEVTTWIKDPATELSSIHKKRLRNRVVAILPPDDYDDIKTAEQLASVITKYAKSARVTAPPPGNDVVTLTDWIELNFPADDPQSYENVYPIFRKFFDKMVDDAIEMKHLPHVMKDFLRTFEEFREVPDFPQRSIVIDPWLHEYDYGFIYGPDGSGKTFLMWEIARGLTHGGAVMGGHWHVETPMNCLIVDSELPPGDIQQRSQLMGIDKSHIISRQELVWRGVWPPINLSDELTQRLIYDTVRKGKFGAVVMDNISSMTDGINPDKEEDWRIVNDFFLSLRTLGVMVIFAGHTGKSGSQRGTSARLDAVDWGLSLIARGKKEKSRGKGVGGEDPCEFSISIGKKRGLMPALTGYTYRFEGGMWHVEEGMVKDEGKGSQDRIVLERHCYIAKGLVEGLPGHVVAKNVNVAPSAITYAKNKLLKAGALKKVTVKGKILLEEGPNIKEHFGEFYGVVFGG